MGSLEENLAAVQRQINECHAMIDHFIQLKDRGVEYATEEIAYWRKMLQNAKIYKRRLLNT